MFVGIFLRICSDDNECMNDDDKCETMIAKYATGYGLQVEKVIKFYKNALMNSWIRL